MSSGLKRLVPIIQQQRARDVSEADTVTLVKDVFAEVLGYDKYADLTGELAIRGTYCDLAVKVGDKIALLVEVKAVGLELTDRHLKQAVDYAANHGIEWVVLSNAVKWLLYEVVFAKPIDKRLVLEVDLTTIDPKKAEQLEGLYPLSKEGFAKGAPAALRDRQDATSRFLIAGLLLYNDAVINVVRRELRRVVDINVCEEDVLAVLRNEVVKRDCVEGPAADEAAQRVKRGAKRALRAEATGANLIESATSTTPPVPPSAV